MLLLYHVIETSEMFLQFIVFIFCVYSIWILSVCIIREARAGYYSVLTQV